MFCALILFIYLLKFKYEKTSAQGIWTRVIKFAVKLLYHYATFIVIDW